MPAWKFLESAPREELIRVLHEYGETSDPTAARRIADAVCLARSAGTLPRRTREFATLVAEAKGIEYQPMHPAKLCFQALRVHLNDEFGELRRGVAAAAGLLRDGGRIGLLTWKHSECAQLVDVFRALEAARAEAPLCAWLRAQTAKGGSHGGGASPLSADGWALTMDDATRPSDAELAANSRSRSAVLHILRRVRAPRMVEVEAKAYALLGWEATAHGTADGGVASASNGVGGGAAKESKADRKARKAQKKAAAAAGAAAAPTAGSDEDDEQAAKDASARRNREEKKALKKRQREAAAASGGKKARQ